MSKFIYRPSGPVISRRQLLKGTAAIAGAAVASSVLPASLRKAAAKTLAYPTRSSLNDIKHIVILMQENRSFDH
jgi:phospholipase C